MSMPKVKKALPVPKDQYDLIRLDRLSGGVSAVCVADFQLLAGVSALVGVWTQEWPLAVGTVVVLIVLSYVLGYRKVLSPRTLSIIAVTSGVLVGVITHFLASYSYDQAQVSHLWFGIQRMLTLKHQLIAGVCLGAFVSLTGFVALFFPNDPQKDPNWFSVLVVGNIVGWVGLGSIAWLLMSALGSIFDWGFGFGYGWQESLFAGYLVTALAGLGTAWLLFVLIWTRGAWGWRDAARLRLEALFGDTLGPVRQMWYALSMSRRHQLDSKIDFSHYEPLEGQRPYRLLDRHPSGRYLALAAPGEQTEAAVWESQTGKLAWVPKGAVLLCWLEQGAQVVQVRKPLDLERPPEQEGHLYLVERQRWPDGTLISRCSVALSQGEPESVVVSPHGNLIILRWLEQGASGWEFIHLRETGDVHLKEAGIELDSEVAVSTQPAFSPDGRYAVSGYHALFNTAAPAWESAHWKIAQQGRYEVGCVTVIRLLDGTCYQIPIADAVPAKLHGTSSRSLDPPTFLDSRHFLVRLPTGAKRRYQVQGAATQSGDSRQR